MMLDAHATTRNAMAAHFAPGGCRPAVEEKMRAHLTACTDCRWTYDRHLLLARLDPAAPAPEDRLARRLGLRAPAARARGWSLGALLGAAAVVGAFLLAPAQRPASPPDAGFKVRGSPVQPAAPELRVYRVPDGSSAPEPATGSIRASDELAFAYRNPGGRRHLLVFAVDEHGHVYWYHPEWSDAAKNPAGVPISGEPGLHELPAAVVQHLDGERLMIHALFTDRELTVRQVEGAFAAAAGASNGHTPVFPGATDIVYPLRVAR